MDVQNEAAGFVAHEEKMGLNVVSAALFVVGALTHKSDKMANTQCGIGLASAALLTV